MEALDFRRAMRKVDDEYGDSWWFKVWGPDTLAEEGIGDRDDWMIRAEDTWHGFGGLAPGFNMLDPIKATVLTPGLDVEGDFAEQGIPAAIVTKYLAEHGVIVEKTGLYSFFIMPRWLVGPSGTGAPSQRSAPFDGRSNPAASPSSVLFPQPDGPTTHATWPAGMRNETSFSTGVRRPADA